MTIDEILKQLTLEEKAALLQGKTVWSTYPVPRLGIPEMFLSDGPHGLRRQAGSADHLGINKSLPATCFPTAATMANSWDPELGQELGRALGREAAAQNVHVVLGPGLNMKRSPLCGRNFEYFSEDPHLAGKMAAAYIRGIQENGTAACPKHFAVNSQELRRLSVDEVLDERTFREIYLTGFEIAVTEGSPRAIMSSYNRINGTYANENRHLLTDILRNAWDFGGFVVTDWGADNDHVEGVRSGSALVMPNPGLDSAITLVKAVREGRISENVLDDRLRELLPVILSTAARPQAPAFDADAHHALARKCAENAIVLLENDGILPLSPETPVAVIGDFARAPRFQGSGSSIVNPTRTDDFLTCAKAAGMTISGFAPGYRRDDPQADPALISQAVALAKGAQTVLLFVGLDELSEAECVDRSHMDLNPGQQALLEAILRANRNVVLVLTGGSPFTLPPAGSSRAVIHGYLGGQAGAGAMADALLGKVNPSGKLSETWPLKLEDTPCRKYFPGTERTAQHREGLYIGYRYYETANVPVRYPFGFGLSYTTFAYSGLSADARAVTFTLSNTGSRDGSETVQVYVSCPGGKVFRPAKELKAFRKVFLKAGESQTVTIPLDPRTFRYFNVKTNRWEVEGGEYLLHIAPSVADPGLTARVHVEGTHAPAPYGSLPHYESGKVSSVPDAEFAELLGFPIPESKWSGLLDRNDALCRLADARSPAGRLIHRVIADKIAKADATGRSDTDLLFTYNMPFRSVRNMVPMVSDSMVEDMVYLFNGHTLVGALRLVIDFLRSLIQGMQFKRRLNRSK